MTTPKMQSKQARKTEGRKKKMAKKPVKKIQKKTSTDSSEHKKRKHTSKTSHDSYKRYIYRILKKVHKDLGMTSGGMTVMNNIARDLMRRLTSKSERLIKTSKRKTLSSKEIQTAVRLLLSGELVKHAISEGTKAVHQYQATPRAQSNRKKPAAATVTE